MATEPRLLVAAPPRHNYPFGLFSAARVETLPAHGGVGVQFVELPCEAGGVVSGSCFVVDSASLAASDKGNFAGSPVVTPGKSFAVASYLKCSGLGETEEEYFRLSEENLNLTQERLVEQVLWSTLDQTGGNSLGSLDVTAGCWTEGAVTTEVYRQAIAALECQQSTAPGMLGTILMPRGLAQLGLSVKALEVHGNGLFTRLGTPVVAGGGFSTANSVTTNAAVWLTGPLGVLQSDVIRYTSGFGSTFDRDTNQISAVTERVFALEIPQACPLAYVEI